jgi:hypothetical protein
MITIKDEDTMTSHNRSDTVAGLRSLADFLETHTDSVPLHTASRTDVQFCILAKDPEVAREEYTQFSGLLYDIAPAVNANYVSQTKRYATADHHMTDLEFGNGSVAYRVLWIEKTGVTEDE